MFDGFVIAEKFVPKEEFIAVCKTMLLSQQLQEDSWDERNNEYHLKENKAAKEAVIHHKLDPFWINIISHWNYYNSNETHSFAEAYLKQTKGENDEKAKD